MAITATSNTALKVTLPDAVSRDPAGIGLRHAHYEDVIEQKPPVGWLEVHPENYFGGGINRHFLEQARALYPISFHAVGLSLGSTEPVSIDHLKAIKELIEIYEPFRMSDHASWSASGNAHLNDLLPLPYTEETLQMLCRNIERTQDFLGRQILVENPSTYVAFAENDMEEWEFMNEAARRTGCGILLDVNNIYVQAHNHGNDPYEYIANIDPEPVEEMHLAGHTEKEFDDHSILIDTHNQPVRDEVWDLYKFTIERLGSIPTLIEWDQDFPDLEFLVSEASKARNIINNAQRLADAAE